MCGRRARAADPFDRHEDDEALPSRVESQKIRSQSVRLLALAFEQRW
jgi:hypothetical protein